VIATFTPSLPAGAPSTTMRPKPITLANLQDGIILMGTLQIDSHILAEVADFPEADEIETFDRGNLQKQIAFMATREHDDEDDAELFANTHAEEVLGAGILTLRGGAKKWVRVYKAICTRCSTKAEGVATFSSYEFTAGLSGKKSLTN
jgi:hypothetical protein